MSYTNLSATANNLKFLYLTESKRSNTDYAIKQNLSTYISKLKHEIKLKILAADLIKRHLVAASATKTQRVIELLCACVGLFIPALHIAHEMGYKVSHFIVPGIHLAKDAVELGVLIDEEIHHLHTENDGKVFVLLHGKQVKILTNFIADELCMSFVCAFVMRSQC